VDNPDEEQTQEIITNNSQFKIINPENVDESLDIRPQSKYQITSISPLTEKRNRIIRVKNHLRRNKISKQTDGEIVEGFLFKKSRKMFKNFKKVYCKIDANKFKIYKNYSNKLLSLVLDFKIDIIHFKKDISSRLFQLNILSFKNKFIELIAPSDQSFKIWGYAFERIMTKIFFDVKKLTNIIQPKDFMKNDKRYKVKNN